MQDGRKERFGTPRRKGEAFIVSSGWSWYWRRSLTLLCLGPLSFMAWAVGIFHGARGNCVGVDWAHTHGCSWG